MDLLDCVGNTAKATTKGFAIGPLASFLLFSAYMNEVSSFSGSPFTMVSDVSFLNLLYVMGLFKVSNFESNWISLLFCIYFQVFSYN